MKTARTEPLLLMKTAKRASTTANVWAAARCIGACNFDAVYNGNDSANDELNCKMAEYAKAVVDGRPAFHINIVNQVSALLRLPR